MAWDEALVNKVGEEHHAAAVEGRIIDYTQALHEAVTLALEKYPEAFLLGQGVDDPSGMFGVTRGLAEKFGESRIFDVPLSEEGITGICVGAAIAGMRPINFHNRPDFLLLAMNQLIAHASKTHFLDNGQSTVPMVVWAAIGRGWGSGAQHSQAIQGLLLGVPGLKIVMPSTAADAKGLFLQAVADNNPVLIFEHRWLMKKKGPVPEGYYTTAFGKGVYRRRGKDLTIVGTSHALQLALQAADEVAKEGFQTDVIDLRTLKPLDEQIIFESVEKTGRLLVVDTGWMMGGACAEIACVVAEKSFHSLKAPVRRLGLPDVPAPAGYSLEQIYYPDAGRIAKVIREMCQRKNGGR
ncbi:MAG: alpha-ketoacid dehydrogenase subunit beta [Deltaproteobacteria bacterium]|nr:alpha-ketoacid dehydrogenase subunit beta [Deltaproteobacteria bacterium]